MSLHVRERVKLPLEIVHDISSYSTMHMFPFDSFIVSVSLKISRRVYVDVRECIFMCLCTL